MKLLYLCYFISSFLPLVDVYSLAPSYLYLSVVVIIYTMILILNGNYSIINPISFISLYIYISLTIGDIIIGQNLIEVENLSAEILRNEIVGKNTVIKIYMILMWIFNITNMLDQKQYKYLAVINKDKSDARNAIFKSPILVLPIILAPFLFMNVHIDTIFYRGYVSHYIAIYMCYALLLACGMSSRKYIIIMIVCLIFMTLKFYGDRREIIYFVYGAFSLYIIRHKPARSFFIKIIVTLPFVISLTLMATILRGEINIIELLADPNKFYSIIRAYLEYENFLFFLAVNSDAANFYIHGIKSMQILLSDTDKILFGSTYLKTLFMIFPRELIPDLKPSSMMTIYTTITDPVYREGGNSYPINFIAEAVWNFYIFSPIFIYYLGCLMNKLYKKLIMNFQNLNTYTIILIFAIISPILSFVRGSGIEYVVYSTLFFLIILLIHQVQNAILIGASKKSDRIKEKCP